MSARSLVFGLVLILAPSFSAVAQTGAAPSESLPKGQIVDKVVCAKSPEQSYALYLPSTYDAARKWPILYAFDPGARGRLPVAQFKDAAEKYGWIVVGSNNSRNGSGQSTDGTAPGPKRPSRPFSFSRNAFKTFSGVIGTSSTRTPTAS